jgi:hypothetical protein
LISVGPYYTADILRIQQCRHFSVSRVPPVWFGSEARGLEFSVQSQYLGHLHLNRPPDQLSWITFHLVTSYLSKFEIFHATMGGSSL